MSRSSQSFLESSFDSIGATLRSTLWIFLASIIIGVAGVFAPSLDARPPTLSAVWNTFVAVHQVSSGCLGLLFLYFLLPLRPKEAVGVVTIGLAVELLVWPFRMKLLHGQVMAAILAVGVGMGGIALLAILRRAVTSVGPERKLAFLFVLMGPMFPLGSMAGGWISAMAHLAQPVVYDTWAYDIDSSLGFSPSFISASIVTFSLAGSWVFYGVYSHLSFFMVAAAGMTATHDKKDGIYFDVLSAFTISAVTGSLLYNLWPLTGPANLFGTFYRGPDFIPWHSPAPVDLRLIAAPVEFSRRAMPSMHATFGLLAAMTMLRNRHKSVRVFAGTFWFLTLIAAAYIGHYAIDFVVALPLTLLHLGLTGRRAFTTSKGRSEAMAIGMTLLAACYLGFLGFPGFLVEHPAFVVVCEVMIVVICVVAERRLAHSGPSGPEKAS